MEDLPLLNGIIRSFLRNSQRVLSDPGGFQSDSTVGEDDPQPAIRHHASRRT